MSIALFCFHVNKVIADDIHVTVPGGLGTKNPSFSSFIRYHSNHGDDIPMGKLYKDKKFIY